MLSVTVQDISSLVVCTGQAPLVSQTKVCWQRLSPSPPDSNRGPRLVGEGGGEEGRGSVKEIELFNKDCLVVLKRSSEDTNTYHSPHSFPPPFPSSLSPLIPFLSPSSPLPLPSSLSPLSLLSPSSLTSTVMELLQTSSMSVSITSHSPS